MPMNPEDSVMAIPESIDIVVCLVVVRFEGSNFEMRLISSLESSKYRNAKVALLLSQGLQMEGMVIWRMEN